MRSEDGPMYRLTHEQVQRLAQLDRGYGVRLMEAPGAYARPGELYIHVFGKHGYGPEFMDPDGSLLRERAIAAIMREGEDGDGGAPE